MLNPEALHKAKLEFISAAQAAIEAGLDVDTLRLLIYDGAERAKAAQAESMWPDEEDDA
jgi:hypothetical protein